LIVEYIRYKVDLDRAEAFVQAYQLASRALDQSEFCRGYELSQCTEDKRVFRAAYPGHPWRPDMQRDIVRQALSRAFT
jgi:hypothetical protein